MQSQKKQPQNQHARVRRDHSSETAEDYVEAIAELIQKNGECRLVGIAKMFAVSHVTANRTVARLKRDGLVESEPYGPITLTDAGRRLAAESGRRHKVVLDFLLSLGISRETAEKDAEGIEHHVSKETLRAFAKLAKGSAASSKE